ncbi:MAG: hypothetical protein A3G27_18945 [Betaproteobacteria bacterium RIFCSPLOWO2_12_FULL_66_14]|nr:MAG: hypothetical protein A3G27_18945 [Betaproteobacteria bacterium RIFCSPLOWO2_12_FULL_66_14]
MLSAALGLEGARVISLCGAGGKTTLMFALAREFVARGERVLVTTTTKIARAEAAGAEAGGRTAMLLFSGVTPDGRKLSGIRPELVNALSRTGEFDRILVEADGAARRPLKASAPHEPVIPSSTDALIAVAGLNGLGLPLQEVNVFRAEIWAQLTGTRLGSPVTAESIARMALHAGGFFKGSPAGARRILFLNRADTPERLGAAMQVAELLASSRDRPPERVALGCLLPTPRIDGGAQVFAAESGHPRTLLLD